MLQWKTSKYSLMILNVGEMRQNLTTKIFILSQKAPALAAVTVPVLTLQMNGRWKEI